MTAIFGFQAGCVGLLAGHFGVFIRAAMSSRSWFCVFLTLEFKLRGDLAANGDRIIERQHRMKLSPLCRCFYEALGITGDFIEDDSRDELKAVPRFCVFTDWLKVDLHCFPRALIGWNNATAGKQSTFPLALLLQHFILICWCLFTLSMFRATAFYLLWIIIQRI